MAASRSQPSIIDIVRHDWPEQVCSVTVVRVRARRHLLAGLWHWFRIRRQLGRLERQPIVVTVSVSVRAGTLTFQSLWPDVRSLLLFNGLSTHVEAVRWVIRGRHESWTGVFRSVGLSSLSLPIGAPNWLDAVADGARAGGGE